MDGQESKSKSSTNVADLRIKSMKSSSKIVENSKLNDEDDDFFKNVENDFNETNVTDTSGINQNEALPSIVQKKIGKILQKLQFISTLRDSVNMRRMNDAEKENGTSSDDFEKIQQNLDDVNLDDDKEETSSNKVNRFDVSSVGVFFAELVGTAVGLLLGAAAHLANLNQNSN